MRKSWKNKIRKEISKIKKQKIFTPAGLILIFLLLFLGAVFPVSEKLGKPFFDESQSPVFFKSTMTKYKIGFVTDAHSRVTKNGVVRLESRVPMTNFVSKMNESFQPDFVVDGGDFIDGTRRFGAESLRDYKSFSRIFEKIKAPKYQVIGNHELRGFTREDWVKLNNYERSYYYFDYDKLRVIVFDSTLIPGSEESSKTEEYEKELAWLEETLKNSEGRKSVIFTHYPFVPLLRKTTPMTRIVEFNRLVSKYGVRAVFSGHVEVLYHQKIMGVDYFVVPGFFRSEATGVTWLGSFSEIKLGLGNTLEFFYKKEGDKEYRSVLVPSEEYREIEKMEREQVNFLAPTD